MNRRPPRSTLVPYTTLFRSAADLPTAFPYFIAIERLVEAGTATPIAVLVLLGYGVIYCLPCLVLLDRKSTRLNSSHANISYAVFCLNKKQHVHAKRPTSFQA